MSRLRFRILMTVVFGSMIAAMAWPIVKTFRPRAVTFNRDVAPIIHANCASCHRPGEAAPFDLLSYDDVRSHARQIVEVTQSGFMPPWLPNQQHGFANARGLTPQQKQTLNRWVDTGTPRGDPSDEPAVPTFPQGWQAGTPDLILESPAYPLASAGQDVFRNFVVAVPLTEPRWVQSIELQPTNPRVTHHARLGIDRSNESTRRDAEDPEPGYAGMAWGQDPDGQLVIWAPGMTAQPGTPAVAWRLHPRTSLVLHSHLQPSGKPEAVSFRIGIRFAGAPPTQRPVMLRVGCCDIDIPAGAKTHTVTDTYIVPIDVDVQTIFPHAHSLCQSIDVTAYRPDDKGETSIPLLAIIRFDENWHESYRYTEPKRLPWGTRIVTTFTYDNSDGNIRNRSRPPKRVVYGSNVTDEMADVYLQVTPAKPQQRAVLMEHYQQYDLKSQVAGHRKVLELDPANPWSQDALAACSVALGDPAAAIAMLENRLKTGRNAVFPVVSLGMAHLAGGNALAATIRFREAITLDKDYPLAWFGLGKALVLQKKLEDAESAFRTAITLAPGLTDAYLSLADLLLQRGQLEEAHTLGVTALVQSPDMANLHLKLAEIAAKRKRYDECYRYCISAQELAPYTHPPKVLLAVFHLNNGEGDRAVQLLSEARAESPGHPVPLQMLGQLARMQKQYAVARDCFAAAAQLGLPDTWPESHRQRFQVLLQSERFQLSQQMQDPILARDALREWMKCEPENRRLKTLWDELPLR